MPTSLKIMLVAMIFVGVVYAIIGIAMIRAESPYSILIRRRREADAKLKAALERIWGRT